MSGNQETVNLGGDPGDESRPQDFTFIEPQTPGPQSPPMDGIGKTQKFLFYFD